MGGTLSTGTTVQSLIVLLEGILFFFSREHPLFLEGNLSLTLFA